MGKTASSIKEFATIAFILLGVLLGMMIMVFLFSILGSAGAGSISDVTTTTTNRSGAFINQSVYTIPDVANSNFTGGFTVIEAFNVTDGELILAANYTVDASAGTLTNATDTIYQDVNITYSVLEKTQIKQSAEEAQNNSVTGIISYTAQSDTQMITVAIAITLIILVAVFLFFWKAFVSEKKGKMQGGNF